MQTQIEHELALIADLGYEHYFLTVADIVRFAQSQGILCQGRGSAANSVVCYCIGVTEVDPARMSVLFERFISKERNEPPDIDVDFEHQRREEVIQYLYHKYGRDRAALTSVVISTGPSPRSRTWARLWASSCRGWKRWRPTSRGGTAPMRGANPWRNTKYVVAHSENDIRCACFPSLAYTSAKGPSGWPSAERRRTVAIPLDGLYYEVGPDVHLAADNFRATQLHDQYVETTEYLALARVALSYMKVDVIDLLVVGLPVASFQARKGFLEQLMTGVHELGGGKTVEVKRAVALALPQGALVYYTSVYHKQRTIEHEQSLIVDPGSRTFD